MSKLDNLEIGYVGILNVGSGDTKISFDPNNPEDRARAAVIVKDMLRRGYTILVEVERDGQKVFERALDFHDDTCEYIISAPPALPEESAANEPQPSKPKRAKRTTVKAEQTRAVAVGKTSGG